MNWKKYKKPTWTCPLQFTITSPGTLKISYLGYSAQINKWLWKWMFKLELNLKKKKIVWFGILQFLKIHNPIPNLDWVLAYFDKLNS